jgi:hypothetical protein
VTLVFARLPVSVSMIVSRVLLVFLMIVVLALLSVNMPMIVLLVFLVFLVIVAMGT